MSLVNSRAVSSDTAKVRDMLTVSRAMKEKQHVNSAHPEERRLAANSN
jgi:hypothetical protein